MQDNKKYLLLGIAILLMTVFFAYFFGDEKETVNWREDYKEANKGPFGTFLTLKLLEEYFPNQGVTILKDSIATQLENEENPANYVFVGGNIYMDSVSESSLLQFVEKGNKAFIAVKSPPMELMQQIFYDECDEFYWETYAMVSDSNAYFNLQHPDLKLDSLLNVVYEEKFDTTIYNWHHFPVELFCPDNEELVQLGSLNDGLVNFMKMDYGEGSFYFHTNPILYTNSVLKMENGFEYAHRSFAHLQTGEIYWDNRSRIWHFDSNNGDGLWNGKKTFQSEGPLQYVLAQPSLAWAWYLALALGLLYLLFRAKRQQRVIPVTEPNRNTSLEFISTIGRMYFVQNNHRKLAFDKMKLFLAYVREHYKMQTKILDNDFVQQLSDKAEVPSTLIKKILETQEVLKISGTFTEDMLIEFHHTLNQFYKNCK